MHEVTQTRDSLALMNGGFQEVPPTFSTLSTISGLARRVADLAERLTDISLEPTTYSMVKENEVGIDCTQLSVSTPQGERTLLRDVSFSVSPGRSLVITGPSGCGKSSLLRVLSGLWEADGGMISRPSRVGRGGLYFMPQKPYMCIGSLRQQVLYPEVETTGHDGSVKALLEKVGLGGTVRQFGLDAVMPWENTLSLGEQQRLAFARLLHARPQVVVMDEATSALDTVLEATCLQAVADLGVAMLSVAHRESVQRFHQQMLAVGHGGQFELTIIGVDGDEEDIRC